MSYIASTYSLGFGSQQIIQNLKKELLDRQNEIASGRKSDLAAILGPQLKQSINANALSAHIKTYIENNKTIRSRLDIILSSLENIADNAERFKSELILSQNDNRNRSLIAKHASDSLELMISTLNASIDDKYVFSGEKTNITAVKSYFDTPASEARAAVKAAFSSIPPDGFGFYQSSPMVTSITSEQLDSFINGSFGNLFSSETWNLSWSNASPKPLTNRISPMQRLETSVTANDPALRKITMAYVMACDLGAENMSEATYQTLARRTTEIIDEGLRLLNSTRTRVGMMQQTMDQTNDSLGKQSIILETQIAKLEGVDQTEIAAKTSNLITQLETSYTLTSRLSKLSLIYYL